MRLVKIPGVFGTWDEHKHTQRKKNKTLRISIIYCTKLMLKAAFTHAINILSLSYHDVVVVQLEAVQDPGG